jgi:hypothetical protein
MNEQEINNLYDLMTKELKLSFKLKKGDRLTKTNSPHLPQSEIEFYNESVLKSVEGIKK